MTSTPSAVVCAHCGAVSPLPDEPPLTWSPWSDGDTRRWTCDRCVRDHLRDIEGRLDLQRG